MGALKEAVVYLLKERIAKVCIDISDTAECMERFKDGPLVRDALKTRIAEAKQKKAELEKLLAEAEAHGCTEAEKSS